MKPAENTSTWTLHPTRNRNGSRRGRKQISGLFLPIDHVVITDVLIGGRREKHNFWWYFLLFWGGFLNYFSSRPLRLCLVALPRWERWLFWAWSHSWKRWAMMTFNRCDNNTCVFPSSFWNILGFFKGKFYLEDPSGTVQLDMSKAISFKCLSRFLNHKNINNIPFLVTHFESLIVFAPVSQWPVHRILLRACRGWVSRYCYNLQKI